MTKHDDLIAATEKRLLMLKAKAAPTFRYARQAARALDRGLRSMKDDRGNLRDGAEGMFEALSEALGNLHDYYEPLGARLLPKANHEPKE